ncbi:hypothetical protein RRG08_022879 [Elysia crispata]|uniref:Uncharacterized protein n=1 Tax=Elysia crispata TaxID=231223 RepID=A0AAE0Z0P4_9GAST|nr:hypothetical protein RRG08_022879 [Elysia crispata]
MKLLGMEGLVSEKCCPSQRGDMSKDRGVWLSWHLSQLVSAGRKTRPSSSAQSASSSRRSHFRRSWMIVCVATAAILLVSIHQSQAAHGSARQRSLTRPSRFHRVGHSAGKPVPKNSPRSSYSPSPPKSSRSPSPSSPSSPSSGSPKPQPDALARLSKVFGISRIPHGTIHRSPPQYMQELYASTTDTGGLTRARGPYNSNTIRSFPDKGGAREVSRFCIRLTTVGLQVPVQSGPARRCGVPSPLTPGLRFSCPYLPLGDIRRCTYLAPTYHLVILDAVYIHGAAAARDRAAAKVKDPQTLYESGQWKPGPALHIHGAVLAMRSSRPDAALELWTSLTDPWQP